MTSPLLLRLPPELHYDIVDLLEIQDKARLSRTNQYFSSLIKPPTHQEFLAAETGQWSISSELFTCKGCIRFRPLIQFTDDMRKGKRGRNGAEANTRFCIKCGVDRDWFALGAEFSIMGRRYVRCEGKDCRHFTSRVGIKGFCNIDSPTKRHVRKKSDRPYNGNREYESDDDWDYLTRSCVNGKHSEEMYGVWPEA
ncbi:hypothetical protein BCR34DRAFT_585154 [Clohesyomyces aquaticus]|uniref:F-box domain-containing protein n=1 Tax=Clohesyomyces aquaticus TaxID=1231657 RepID=A0A1Y1ZYC9_9PLEO|nr:hypothetical protein BCR34DRAFT_585154 [Clohesyomyces aquaticus]